MFTAWWAVAIAWKGTVVLMAAIAANAALWRRSAALRHMVWAMALGSLLVLPMLETVLPNWGPTKMVYVPAAREVRVAIASVGVAAHRAASPRNGVPVAFGIWLAGALVCGWRWRRGIAKVARMRRDAVILNDHEAVAQEVAAEIGLDGRVQLLRSSREIVPLAAGIWRPVVVLPASESEWSHERLRVVLLHELAHIKRGDSLMQALAELALCLYWFHPLVWPALRGLRVERERACDDLVLRAGTGASDYASHLLGLARSLKPAELSPVAMSMAGTHLETRIRAILNPRTNRRCLGRASGLMACVAAACLVVPLAAMRPQAGNGGVVSGTVYDPAGARVPGASVIAIQTDNGQKLTTTTDQEGKFSVGPLPGGPWQITVEVRGFAPRTIEGVDKNHYDITLDVGQMQETLVVRAKGTAAVEVAERHRVRVGGNVVPAKLVSKIDPEYPEDARARGIHGEVVLRAVISVQGAVLSPTAISTPDPQLAEAAMKAVREWRYQPSLLNGEPVETVTTITVNFELEP
ncbi:MAG TPA: M56 family metallopeptidase [Bryobacteraceae bacterium]|nr:M56 family metallopeptidase [Bryobacteraceae bacterium]